MRYKANGVYPKQYSTKQNDTFDKIALYFYGEEKLSTFLIDANPQYSNVIIFDEGVKLYLPRLELIEAETLPKWKGGL